MKVKKDQGDLIGCTVVDAPFVFHEWFQPFVLKILWDRRREDDIVGDDDDWGSGCILSTMDIGIGNIEKQWRNHDRSRYGVLSFEELILGFRKVYFGFREV